RDPIRYDPGAPADADVETRLALLRGPRVELPAGQHVSGDAVRRIRQESDRLLTSLGRHQRNASPEKADVSAGLLLAFAYPDRLAQLRAPRSGRFLLRNGNGAALAGAQSLSDSPYLVAAELDGRRPESHIFLAASISLEEIEQHFGDQTIVD